MVREWTVRTREQERQQLMRLKNVLLDTFLVIKGEDMDIDKTHSDDLPVPPKKSLSESNEIF